MGTKQQKDNKTDKLDLDAFKEKLKTVTCATGIEETSVYSEFIFDGDKIHGTRFQACFKKSDFNINIKKLHDAYCAQSTAGLNTSDLRKYVSGKQAPALAILLAAGLTKHKTNKRKKTK